jgi:hypothetical protein
MREHMRHVHRTRRVMVVTDNSQHYPQQQQQHSQSAMPEQHVQQHTSLAPSQQHNYSLPHQQGVYNTATWTELVPAANAFTLQHHIQPSAYANESCAVDYARTHIVKDERTAANDMCHSTTPSTLVGDEGGDEEPSTSAAYEQRIAPFTTKRRDTIQTDPNKQSIVRATAQENHCVECAKVFTKPSDLRRHMRVHTGEMPFKCGKCARPFRHESTLANHMRTHAQQGDADDGLFVNVFDQLINKHNPTVVLTCTVCQRMLMSRGALRIHMRIHTGVQPYACTVSTRAHTQRIFGLGL